MIIQLGKENFYGVIGEVVLINKDLEEESVKLMKGVEQTLTLVNEKKWGVTWTSSDEKIATVDENGKVTAVDGGGAIITVTSEDGNHTDQVALTVEKPADLKDNLVGSNEPEYEYVDGSWVKLLQMLENNETDMPGGATFTEERADKILFPSYAMGTQSYCR